MADIFDLFKKIESGNTARNQMTGAVEYIVCGLGNPGAEYVLTRHNAGFMALDYIAERAGFACNRAKFNALTADVMFADKRVLFMKPQTFMNASGSAVRDAAAFYKIPPQNIIVISDDSSLPAGKMRLRRKGSDGGQKGLRDIIYQLSSDTFPRIRLGTGIPPEHGEMISWVLGKIPENERKIFYSCVENTYDAVSLILNGRFDEAMNKYN